MRSQRLGFLIIGLWLIAAPAWAQFRQPDQRPFRSSGGTTAGYINTPSVSSGAVTLLTRCRSAGCTDWDRIANGTNAGSLTITLPTAGLMADAEYLYVQVNDTGTAPSSISFTAPSGVTLKSLILGDTGQTLAATVCGTPPATGSVWYRFNWSAALSILTAEGCGPNAPAAALAVALGGTGLTTLTAHAVQVGAGTSTPAQVGPSSTTGQVLTAAGASADPAFQSLPYPPSFDFGTVTNSQTVEMTLETSVTFPLNFTGTYPDANAQASCTAAPGSADGFLVKCAGVVIGSICVSASCATTGDSGLGRCTGSGCTTSCTGGSAGTQTCAAGNQLQVVAPGTIHNETGLSIALGGHSP